MSVMASIIEAPEGTTPVRELGTQCQREDDHRRDAEATNRPISTRRNSSSPTTHVREHERHHADGPPERHERVAAQGDHRLRDGQAEHVDRRCRQRQHGQGAPLSSAS